MDFPEPVHVKSWNNREKVYICRKQQEQDENYNYFITQIVHVIVSVAPQISENAWFVILVLFSKYQGFEIELSILNNNKFYWKLENN